LKFAVSDLRGIVVPIITPLTANENLDEGALRKIVDHLLKGGVHGIFVNSTTGEAVCLLDKDRDAALKIVVDQVAGRIPVYAGVSDTSTKRALENLARATDSGADIVVAHPPFYYPPNSQEELVAYFTRLANASSLPLMLYNIPFTTKAPLSLETVRRLMQIDKIIGIKDSSVDYVFLMNLIELKRSRPEFRIFIGKSHLWAAGILSGADGGLDGISNLIPGHCVRLYRAIQANSPDVYARQQQINEIFRVYECASFLGGIKAAMSLLGLCEPHTVHPILPASAQEREKITGILKTHKLIA